MSQARSFTIELTQVGTGKKTTVKINQSGFTPEYQFYWKSGGTSPKRMNTTISGAIVDVSLISSKTQLSNIEPIVFCYYSATSNNSSIIENIRCDQEIVYVKLLPNPTYSTRSVTVTLTQLESGKTLTLIITQPGKSDDGIFKADPTELSFGAASDTKSSKITSTSKGQTVGWTVTNKSSMPSWLTISGEGTGTLSANVKDNA